MANLTCTQRLKVCHLRVLRLDDVGEIESGADALYEYGAPVLFNYTPTAPERERIEQLDGCGNQCGLYRGSAKAVDGADLSLTACEQNAELDELLPRRQLVTEWHRRRQRIGPVGHRRTVKRVGTAIEMWSYAWSGRQQAVRNRSPAWYRQTSPKASSSSTSRRWPRRLRVRGYTGVAE